VFGLRVDYASVMAQQQKVAAAAGVWVRDVVPDSPAAKGLKPLGDEPRRWLVTAVDGAAVATPAEFHKAAAGRAKVKLTLRDPSTGRDAEVTLP
jgi:S1-C subfamily serine protease